MAQDDDKYKELDEEDKKNMRELPKC